MHMYLSIFYIWGLMLLSAVGGMCMTNFLAVWVCLELNMLMFIFSLNISKSSFKSENSLKYFIVQAVMSGLMIWTFMIYSIFFSQNSLKMVFMFAILIKLGSVPFHGWYLSMMQKISWMNLFMISTIQKVLPLYILNMFLFINDFMIFILLSASIAVSMAISQITIKRMLAYSSIFNLAWMMSSLVRFNSCILFMILYALNMYMVIILFQVMNLEKIFQMETSNSSLIWKFMMFFMMISLGGIPPLLGFWPKFMILEVLVVYKLILVSFIMVILSVFMLFIYFKFITLSISLSSNKYLFFKGEFISMKSFIFIAFSFMVFLLIYMY